MGSLIPQDLDARTVRLACGFAAGSIVAIGAHFSLKTKGPRRFRQDNVRQTSKACTSRGGHDTEDVAGPSNAPSQTAGPKPRPKPATVSGVAGLIGNTPLMRIESLSELTGCDILGKAEFLNPAGSPKDRVALQILLDAEEAGLISPHHGDCVFEGTVGSTGISLATLCRAKGYRCSIVLPDDVATEKSQLLEKLGAEVKKVRPRGIVDPRHFVNEARALAQAFGGNDAESIEASSAIHSTGSLGHETSGQGVNDQVLVVQSLGRSQGVRKPRGFFADQFETPSNFTAHYKGTGPEIWVQCGGSERRADEMDEGERSDWRRPALDAFVAGAGTGGTLSGVAAALREREAEYFERKGEDELRQTTSGLHQTIAAFTVHLRSRFFSERKETATSAAMTPEPERRQPIRIVLADPHGSGLFNKIHHGVMYSATEAEGTRRRHQVDTIVEGIGMNRVTRNLAAGVHLVDDAVRVTDDEAVRMSRWLSVRDGLFVGSSSAVNVTAAVRTATKLKREWVAQGRQGRPTVVTILCDSGVRHLSKFHNDEVLARDYGIAVPADAMQVDIGDILA